MSSDLSVILEAASETLVLATSERLNRWRPVYLGGAESVDDDVRRCVAAMHDAAVAGQSQRLVDEALAVARTDPSPGRGYRRAQLLLDALCTAAADVVRRRLPRAEAREALADLRSLVGPAQIGLAGLFGRTDATATRAWRETEVTA